ncbi:MAG: molybdopterin molybdenumtransferase MoeA [Desulfobacteraceae bacterium 4572_123]|nr:MAG: molybdopterin molybdenumtransferase MoeA [Desulfobacteraceae bacterium 4572_123]
MKDFFKVMNIEQVQKKAALFSKVSRETIDLPESFGRILASDIIADVDLPGFARSTMDGYGVRAASTFGASEANPAYLSVTGAVAMGEQPAFSIGPGEAARISTGGMLPDGADGVVMVEHAEMVDDLTLEVYKSVAPGQHVVARGEDIRKDSVMVSRGVFIRPQEAGLLAAFGISRVPVYKQPVIGILSTGDEVVPIEETPGLGHIRDINTYTLSGLIRECGAVPMPFGIVGDDYDSLHAACSTALQQTDMLLISGGSSVGVRDFTIEVLSSLKQSEILVHGISISPGKPTILATAQNKAVWGLPGHVVSAMVVFHAVVKPFVAQISGSLQNDRQNMSVPAILSRNLSSAQGRTDYVRVKLIKKKEGLWAEPILGKSGLINTMVKADGLISVGLNTEGLDKGSVVEVALL